MSKYHAGHNATLYGEAGERYLDLSAAGGVMLLGWQPERPLAAALRELQTHSYAPPDWAVEGREALRHKLRDLCSSPDAGVLPVTTGTEGVEVALRIARNATGRTAFAVVPGSYHGASVAAAALCTIDGWTSEPDRRGFTTHVMVPPERADEQSELLAPSQARECAAVVIEPAFANAGFRLPPADWMKRLRLLCDSHGLLMIADEVNSALGRVGRFLGGELFDLHPDMTILGKGLAAGVYPLSAVLVAPELDGLMGRPGTNPSSYAWAPPGCAAALATLEQIEDEGLIERACALRVAVTPELQALEDHFLVAGITGQGLGIGIVLHETGEMPPLRLRLRRRLLEVGVVVAPNPNLPGLVLSPPLTIGEAELRRGLEMILRVLGSDLGVRGERDRSRGSLSPPH